jgi:hypothetical protein
MPDPRIERGRTLTGAGGLLSICVSIIHDHLIP